MRRRSKARFRKNYYTTKSKMRTASARSFLFQDPDDHTTANHIVLVTVAAGTLTLGSVIALADSIDPISFEATLNIGESVTVPKTVVVESAGPADALVDLMFVFDLTGSMGDEILDARSSADGVLGGLSAGYDLRSGTSWYADHTPGARAPSGIPGGAINVDLNGSNTAEGAGINDMWEGYTGVEGFATPPWCSVGGVAVGCGGDFPETGYDGIAATARGANWREGSNRFIVALGDSSFKDGVDSEATTVAALDDSNVSLLGLSYGASFSTEIESLIGMTARGGMVSESGDDLASFVDAAITDIFAEYSTVTVSDLGVGLPGISVSTICTSTDPGIGGPATCDGADAVGSFDRSVDRSFTFDVTFTAEEAGVYSFDTLGLVDGGAVAVEADLFTVRGDDSPNPVPLPGTLALLGLGLAGLSRRGR